MPNWRDAEKIGPLSASQKISGAVKKLAPYATTMTTQNNLGTLSSQTGLSAPKSTGGGSAVEQLASWTMTVGSQAGSLIGGVGKWLWDEAVRSIEAPIKFGASIGNEIVLSNSIDANSKEMDGITQQIAALSQDYRAGRISKEEYKTQINTLNQQSEQLRQEAQGFTDKANQNASDTLSSGVDTALDVISIVTAGASEGLTPIVSANVKTAVDGSVAPMIDFFGDRVVSETLASQAAKIDTIVSKVISGVDKVVTFGGKFPEAAIAKIANETIAEGAAELTSSQIARNVAMNVLLKKPLIYQTNLGIANDIYNDLLKHDLSGAALMTTVTAAMALSGGPIGWAMQQVGRGGEWLKAAMYGKGNVAQMLEKENAANIRNGLAENISKEIIEKNRGVEIGRQSYTDAYSVMCGDGRASAIVENLAERAAKGDVRSYELWKIGEETNMKMAKGDAVKAAHLATDYLYNLDGGRFLRAATIDEIIDTQINWAAAREAVVADAIKNGMSKADAMRIVVGRANQSDLDMIAEAISTAEDSLGLTMEKGALDQVIAPKLINARAEIYEALKERYGRTAAWANSRTFDAQMYDAIKNNPFQEDVVKAIKGIVSTKPMEGLSKEMTAQLAKDGFIATMPVRTYTPYVSAADVAGKKLATNFAGEAPDLFEQAVKPLPVLQSFARFLGKLGLSPEVTQDEVYASFKSNFSDYLKNSNPVLDKAGEAMDGERVLSKLYAYARDKATTQKYNAPIMDLRQMTRKEIEGALNITEQEAKKVMVNLNNAMLKVPFELRGLGERIQDINFAFNPMSRQFSRIQGATRYVYNPFFRWQQAYQTEAFAQAEAGGKMLQIPFLNRVNKVLFKDEMAANARTIQIMEDRHIFAPGFTGQGATGDVFGLVGNRVIKSEKVSIAGLVNEQARKYKYVDVSNYIDDHFQNIVDTARAITISTRSANVLDSPLVRTINTAFFPFRFNMKTSVQMAKYIGQLSTPTQIAVIYGLYRADTWLRSDEGIAWQSQYSEAINLFQYLSPTYPLSYVMKLGRDIVDPSDATVGDLGLLGGLPFGMVTQFLEGAGITNFQAPYVNPKTGDVMPKYVPKTAQATINLALQDFLGAVFSYPGQIVGLPGKSKIIRDITNTVVGGANDFAQINQSSRLTPQQIREQQVIQNLPKNQVGKIGPTATQNIPTNVTSKVPGTKPQEIPVTVKPPKARKKKKSEYIPQPIK